MRTRSTLLLAIALSAALLLWRAPAAITRWRADQTARSFAVAMFRGDTATQAQVSELGSAHTALCLRTHWPGAFWERDRRAPLPRLMRLTEAAMEYEVVGDPLPQAGGHAVYEVHVARRRPDRILRIFADARLGVWTPEVRDCLQP